MILRRVEQNSSPGPKPLLFLSSYFQAGVCALQITRGPLELFLSMAVCELRLCALLGLLGAFRVNVFGTFCGLGQNGHLVRQHLGESPRHRQVVSVGAFAIGDLPNREFGDQRGMSWKNAQVPVLAGNLHLLRHVADHHLLRSDDLELESIGHTISRWSLAVGRWSG